MSNILQFFGKPYPIGSVVPFPYGANLGSKLVTIDGTEWINLYPSASFDYTSDYADLPDTLKSPHPLMPGPETDGTWARIGNLRVFSMAYRPSSTLYVTPSYGFDSVANASFYYTSTNASTWTKRNFPNSIIYDTVEYTAGKFIAFSSSSGDKTKAILTSTDGINWTERDSGVLVTYQCQDIVSDGANKIFITPNNYSTAGLYSADGGVTWAQGTMTLFQYNLGRAANGLGTTTWNAGAGLFISGAGAVQAAGRYQTSPTGQTWTTRTAVFSDQNAKFASNSTMTVIVTNNGLTATSTDGINWTNFGSLEDETNVPSGVNNGDAYGIYYDGTRFVVKTNYALYHSTNGSTWTKSTKAQFSWGGACASNGMLFVPAFVGQVSTLLGSTNKFKMLRISDATLTSPIQTVWIPSSDPVVNNISNDKALKGQALMVRIK